MSVVPTTRSSFTSTIWGGAARGRHSVNAAKFGGPNVKITEGSKVQFTTGKSVWDVVRVFNDGTIYLVSTSGGERKTRMVEPEDPSWHNLWIVDRRRFSNSPLLADVEAVGGGPNRDLRPGTVIIVGDSQLRWVVQSVLRDSSVIIQTYKSDTVST